jgi:L-asparaginase II
MMPEVLAIAYREGLEESRHFGSVVVVDKTGKILFSRGNPDRVTFLRSAAKPLQVLPLFDTSAAENLNITLDEVAVMCGSHSGEDMHADRVNSILTKAGLCENNLLCGVHSPFHKPTAERLRQANEIIGPVRNACSGKHSCMLAITQNMKWPVETYMELAHPVQQLMLKTVAEMSEFPARFIGTGLDACGVPVFAVPLKNMALAYANLASADKFTGSRRKGIEQIQKAMAEYPELIAGTKRFTSELLKAAGGRFVAKDGSESSFGVGVIPEGIGIAVKIEDGSDRALGAVVMEVLKELNLLDENMSEQLSKFKKRVIKTWGGVVAGEIAPVQLFKNIRS